MKKKKKKGLIIAAVAVVAVIAVVILMPKGTAPVMASVNTEGLQKMDLKRTVSATGTVESDNSEDVYSKLAGTPIKTVNVEVGDQVKAGDVLALFDTEEIEDAIAQQEASMNTTAAANQQAIKLNEKQYQQQIADFNASKDANLLAAEKAVNDAQDALSNAKYAFEHFGEDVTSMDIDELVTDSQKNKYNYTLALHSYQASLEELELRQKELDAAKQTGDKDKIKIAQEKYDADERELGRARTEYENQKAGHSYVHHEYEQAQTAVKQAEQALELAMQQYEITWNATLRGIDSAKDSIDTSKISSSQAVAQLTLEKYRRQLEDAVVIAPVSGTVTAVYAKEGATPSGLLFIIEDTGNLKVKTTIKEYDLPSIKVGLPAEIKSDGTGDAVMTGKVEKIAPTAVKADSEAKASTGVEFEVEISVDKPHDGLLIGMKARSSIILQEANGVYGVPFDAIMTDADGTSYIFVAEADGKGMSVAKKVPVQIGMESDFYVEVSGEGLADGLLVVTSPAGIFEGMPLPVSQPAAGAQA